MHIGLITNPDSGRNRKQIPRIRERVDGRPGTLHREARSPEEIALCVMSEITLLRRGGSGMRMRDKLQEQRRLRAAAARLGAW